MLFIEERLGTNQAMDLLAISRVGEDSARVHHAIPDLQHCTDLRPKRNPMRDYSTQTEEGKRLLRALSAGLRARTTRLPFQEENEPEQVRLEQGDDREERPVGQQVRENFKELSPLQAKSQLSYLSGHLFSERLPLNPTLQSDKGRYLPRKIASIGELRKCAFSNSVNGILRLHYPRKTSRHLSN